MIVSHLKAVSEERLESSRIVAERTPDGRLDIYVDWAGGERKNREACSFEIELPDALGVGLTTSNGGIEVTGLGGLATLTSSNGRVEVSDHAGSVEARTSNGAISVNRIDGSVVLQSSNGKVSAANISGEAEVRTSNGAISIAFGPQSRGPVDVQTSNGSITLELGSSFAGELLAKTSNGSVSTENLPEPRLLSLEKNKVCLLLLSAFLRRWLEGSDSKETVFFFELTAAEG